MFNLTSTGSFTNIERLLKNASSNIFGDLNRYGEMGVAALARATPTESGKTAKSWEYRILRTRTHTTIEWFNTNENNGENIAILIQYGHGTGTGGYVQGIDYINPAIRPVFERISDELWRKVTA